jgi:hypothetical protein
VRSCGTHTGTLKFGNLTVPPSGKVRAWGALGLSCLLVPRPGACKQPAPWLVPLTAVRSLLFMVAVVAQVFYNSPECLSYVFNEEGKVTSFTGVGGGGCAWRQRLRLPGGALPGSHRNVAHESKLVQLDVRCLQRTPSRSRLLPRACLPGPLGTQNCARPPWPTPACPRDACPVLLLLLQGYIMDRRVGNGKGYGALFGILAALVRGRCWGEGRMALLHLPSSCACACQHATWKCRPCPSRRLKSSQAHVRPGACRARRASSLPPSLLHVTCTLTCNRMPAASAGCGHPTPRLHSLDDHDEGGSVPELVEEDLWRQVSGSWREAAEGGIPGRKCCRALASL